MLLLVARKPTGRFCSQQIKFPKSLCTVTHPFPQEDPVLLNFWKREQELLKQDRIWFCAPTSCRKGTQGEGWQRTTRKPTSSSLKPQLLKGPIFIRQLPLKPKITLAKQFPPDISKMNETKQHLSYIKNPMAWLLAKFIAPRKPRDISLCSPQTGNGKNTWTLKSWEIFVDTRIWGA